MSDLHLEAKGDNELVHEHFILDANLGEALSYRNRNEITEKLVFSLMEALKMHPLGKLETYDATDPQYPGWSFIQPITTSHISGHYFEESEKPSHLHLDIYSCKIFDWNEVIKIVHEQLNLAKWTANYIIRANESSLRTIQVIEGTGLESFKKSLIVH